MKKAERRHELEHNELDDALVKSTQFLRDNGAVIAIVTGVVLLAGFVYFYVFTERPISADAGPWQHYFFALSDQGDAKKELESFIDKQDKAGKSGDLAVLWARISLGNLKLAEGDRELFENRQLAQDSLDAAEKDFLAVEKHAPRNVELRDRANLGLAKVYESQNKPKEAQNYYARLAKDSPDSPEGRKAARSERRLAQKGNVEFLAWFAQQKPKPVRSKSPLGDDFKNPPEQPDYSVPPLDGSSEKPITPGLKIPSKLSDDSTEPDSEKSPDEKSPDQETEGSPK